MENNVYGSYGHQYHFADGYTDGTADDHHYYIRDHQGNNRVVAKYDGTIEQTIHYYPYGGILTHSTEQGVQKYKYNGKEFDNMHGLNMYDYGAGNDVTPQVRLVPQNVKGNVKPNRTNADQLIKNSDGTYSIVETKLSSKNTFIKRPKERSRTCKKRKWDV